MTHTLEDDSVAFDDGHTVVATFCLIGIGCHDQGEYQAHYPDDHQDQTDRVDAKAFRLDAHSPIQDCTESD